ncbi:uncharacterized protein DUF397 [Actinomadura pelletieri DSM 43383]|uniref:Uncharacterized protein DUF397 n=1 Tax=Actinomadura pelletieri DSM 43383 TaxID=1120940 RepID=A0A495QXP7_9ACTN|nr:DUF397 domain-containing protein [Actinomadura pelletieri]RKS78898.1 uncharacterized protein DUF397 [Actinomadura pelletieri DSM 43383]
MVHFEVARENDQLDRAWRKSSYSGSTGGDCVEVAADHGAKAVRDSKNPEGDVLNLRRDAWAALVTEIKQGAHDL